MIIAEIGQNFMGDMELAKKLIRLAKENGAGLAKFQLYDYKVLYRDHPLIPDVALSFDQAKMLFNYGAEIGIDVFFSVFDVERVKWCEEIGVKRYKIANSVVTDSILLGAIWGTGKPVIISIKWSQEYGLYPQFIEAVKLLVSPKYPAQTSDYLGYCNPSLGCFMDGISDHTIGLDAAKIALARGASIIEKHFAIDHQTGVDAQWSMTPDELTELVRFNKVVKEIL